MMGRRYRTICLIFSLFVAFAGSILFGRTADFHAPQQTRQIANAPNFSRDIAPILYANCAACHHAGGHGPFPLLTYEDAKKHSAQILVATRTRKMPPWLPSHGYGDFIGELRLTAAQIQLISDWVNTGAPEGSSADAPAAPKFSDEWQLGPPDLILEAEQPVSVPAKGPDIFWNFIFSPAIKTAQYVRAIEIRPGGGSMLVHHANLIVDTARSARRHEKEHGEGYPGMDVGIERAALDIPSHFLFWKPGSTPWIEPDGYAWKLNPGVDLVLNAHLKSVGRPEDVKPSIGLYFTDKPPAHFPMLIQLQDDNALEIPAGAGDFVVRDDFRLPVDADVLAIYPHAHYLGHLLEGFATLPTGERKWLIRIPNWDPNWQSVYHYRKPVFLPKGSVVSMRYHYDNSSANPRNPNHPPKKVQGGDQSTDEMAHLWLQILPRGNGDHRPMVMEALMRHRIEKYRNDLDAHLYLATLLIARLNPAEADAVLEDALRFTPRSAEAHDLRGSALGVLGRTVESREEFQLALQLKPEFGRARYNFARGLVKSGQFEKALEQFRLAAADLPENAQVHNDFGELLLKLGKPADALKQFQRALALDPTNRSAQENRDQTLKSMNHP